MAIHKRCGSVLGGIHLEALACIPVLPWTSMIVFARVVPAYASVVQR